MTPFTLSSGRLSVELDLPEHATVLNPHVTAGDWSGLQQPLGLPALHECIVDGDQVTLVVDPDTPQLIELITEVVQHLTAGTAAPSITLLLPPETASVRWDQFQEQLPLHLQEQLTCHIHDPAEEQQCGYLASSAGGDRIYLSTHLIDADLIVSIGTVARHPQLGFRGTNSAIFPALSDRTANRRASSGTDSSATEAQPVTRELIDEIGWLLGTQFCVQVVPSGDGKIARLFCGAADQVQQQAQQWLQEHWTWQIEEPVDLAIISIPHTQSGFAWKQLGQALAALHRAVDEDARVAIIADLPASLSGSLEILRRCDEPTDLLKPLRLDHPPDATETIQLIEALRRWKVFVLSDLSADTIEDLGGFALADGKELQRLLDSAQSSLIVPSASYAKISLSL